MDSFSETILGQVSCIWYPGRVQKDQEAISVTITMAVTIAMAVSMASTVIIVRTVTMAITSFLLQIKLGKTFLHPWQYRYIVYTEGTSLGRLTWLQTTKQVELFNVKKVAALGGQWSKPLLLGLGGQECSCHGLRWIFVPHRRLFSQLQCRATQVHWH